MSKSGGMSGTELEVLKTLWETGPCTVRTLAEAFQGRGRSWAYTTVQTLLNRLESKGYVKRDSSGAAHVYRAVYTRDRLLRQRLRDLANDLCNGAATPLLTALIDSRTFSTDDIAAFRKLLDSVDSNDDAN